MSKVDVLRPFDEIISNEATIAVAKFKAIRAEQLIKCINLQTIKLYDLRDTDNYRNCHIVNAEHVSCATNLMTKKSIQTIKSKIDELKMLPSTMVVIYNNRGEKLNDRLLTVLAGFQHVSIYTLQGGFEEFKKKAPKHLLQKEIMGKPIFVGSPTNPNIEVGDNDQCEMSQIDEHLYLGNEHDSSNFELLKSHGITAIVCVTTNTKFYFDGTGIFEYKRIPASDSCSQDLMQYFKDTYEFIEDVRKANGKVLVHCLAGISRSVTIVMAYLMKKYSMDVFQALEFVREKRPIAGPNIHFLGQLEKFHQTNC